VKVYLTRDFLNSGVIIAAEGTRCTGHPDWIQVRGVKSYVNQSARIYKAGEWHETMTDAVAACREAIDTRRLRLMREEEALLTARTYLDKLEHKVNAAYPQEPPR
jgi:hypothetical protein